MNIMDSEKDLITIQNYFLNKKLNQIIVSNTNTLTNIKKIETEFLKETSKVLNSIRNIKIIFFKIDDNKKLIVNDSDDQVKIIVPNYTISMDELLDIKTFQKECNYTYLFFCNIKNNNNLIDSEIRYITYLNPSSLDYYIFQTDYEYIQEVIYKHNSTKEKFNEIYNEDETMYLGVQKTQFNTMAYSLYVKETYIQYVLDNLKTEYSKTDSDSNSNNLNFNNLESYEKHVKNTISDYIGKTDEELCSILQTPYDNRKSQWIELVYRMLHIKSNRAKEVLDCNLTVRTIRIEKNGKIRESTPLPNIKLKQIATEKWETSMLYRYFSNTVFIFFVFKKTDDCYIFSGVQFWKMNNQDLNNTLKQGWENIKNIINDGVKFEIKENAKGIVISNNLPSKASNPIIHMRPHAPHAYYKLNNGFTVGNPKDGDELPDGQFMTKQSFWMNNSYLLSIINLNNL